MHKHTTSNPLWTRDFTILTIGSVISMFGNTLSGFAISLLVLDYTSSTYLYALVMVMFTAPQLIMPIFSGAILDRFSRKRTIYTLDFLSAAIYALTALLFHFGSFRYPVLLVYAFVIGSIESIYMVAYESFYPLLISEGNYSKAYSIASVLETISSVMVPVSALLYARIGMVPILAINAACFFLAAVFETQIQTEEAYIETQKESRDESVGSGRQMLRDVREGMQYLRSEKGLAAVAVFFMFTSLAGGATWVLTLPYFKANFPNGEYVYMFVWGMMIVGRAVGGMIHYRVKLPVQHKYSIALFVYIGMSILEGTYLYFPVPVMQVMCLASGMLGVTSYTIRISATQHYVPDEKKGRFNGAFNMLNMGGSLAGQMIAGAVSELIPIRAVVSGFMLINLLAAIIVIVGHKKDVAAIYNRQQ